MLDRLLKSSVAGAKKSILILGPRQTGKSTLLRALSPTRTINLANEAEFFKYSQDPRAFSEELSNEKNALIFVDEIQRIPSLLNTIQAIIDEKKSGLRFLLSGSSARKLRRGEANLLPGRIFSYELGGLCAAELKYEIDIEHALKYGFLPEPYLNRDSKENEKLLETYSATYLVEEIQAESLTRNLQGFSRFLFAVGNRSGSILDFTKLSNQAKVSRTSCIRFVEILEDTLIAKLVPSFQLEAGPTTVKHPKLYFFDGGVLNGLLRDFSTGGARRGMLFEQFVYSQLKNSAAAHDTQAEISYYRTRNGVEVDFIVKIKGKIWAIEVKTGEVNDADLKGLRTFREHYPKVEGLIAVTPNGITKKRDGILICGVGEMLKALSL